jgi:hypothetical protein
MIKPRAETPLTDAAPSKAGIGLLVGTGVTPPVEAIPVPYGAGALVGVGGT